ncbi:ferrichrome outer membrane transporter [compost metagenome]
MTTRRPSKEFGAIVQPSVGGENYQRIFALVDTGEFGPLDTTAWFSASATTYDQYGDNPGDLKKHTYNGRIYQPLRDGDFLSLAASYVRNRNNTYGNKKVEDFNKGVIGAGNTSTCLFDPATPGVADDQSKSSATSNVGCGGYYNYFQNPSNTFSLRGQSRFTLTDKLTLTVDPTYQYTLANGGGTSNIKETDQRLQGSQFDPLNPTAKGVDLNGDGDIMDTIKLYSPSNTNTNRYSVNSSLIYALTDNHRLRLSYTFDTSNHRQTGEYGLLRQNGDPVNPFGGYKNGGADPILTLDGTPFQKRNRRSTAELSQFAVQYIGNLFNDAVTLDVGLRAPRFSRDLQNYCYQANTFDAYCSVQTPADNPTAGAPVEFSRKYDDILPNVGVTWRFAPNQQIFGSYSETLSAPRTDDLYDKIPATPEPETSTNIDLGYRYQSGRLIASGSVYLSKFQNYIARAITDVLDENGQPTGETIVTNINAGDVDRWGADGQIGYMFNDNFSLYASASYLGSEVKEDIPGEPKPFETAGKELFEVPEWQYAMRAEYKRGPFTLGVQGKYVDERWTNLVNTEQTPAYTVVDLDARYDLDFINEGMYVQLNVMNLFDEEYLGNISTEISGKRTAALGSPRTAMATLRMTF